MNTPAGQADLFAELARDHGAEGTLSASEEWFARAWGALAYFADIGIEFTADDVRRRAGDPPTDNAIGALFLNASRQRIIRPVGRRRSTRLKRHAASLTVYVGASYAERLA